MAHPTATIVARERPARAISRTAAEPQPDRARRSKQCIPYHRRVPIPNRRRAKNRLHISLKKACIRRPIALGSRSHVLQVWCLACHALIFRIPLLFSKFGISVRPAALP